MASITCHECRVRHEICDHLSFKEFDKLRAENAKLRKWIVMNGASAAADYACAACVPYSTVLVPGFVCGYHVAVAGQSEGDPRG